MKRNISKEELIEKCAISHSLAELTRKLGYISESYHTSQAIKKRLKLFKIDFSHFDSHYHNQLRIKPKIEKVCPVCRQHFLTKYRSKGEKIYCSPKCSSKNIGDERSLERERKKFISRLKTRQSHKENVEKKCKFCNSLFLVKWRSRNKVIYCSTSCSSKSNWTNPIYIENHRKNTIKRIENGQFGWKTRKELSFPEQLYKNFLEKNGFKDKFLNNYIVSRKDLDGNDGNYYLDFYFSEFNVDLEIDGQQHRYLEERIESDKRRDELLSKRGYIIFRVEWREITTENGKKFLKEQQDKLLQYLKGFVA